MDQPDAARATRPALVLCQSARSAPRDAEQRYKRHDMLMIVLCAVLSEVEDWVGMEALAEKKEAWLHPTLCEDVKLRLEAEVVGGRLPVQETVEKDHGRIEIRRYTLSDRIDRLEAQSAWRGLQAFGRIESTRIIGDQDV